MTNPACTLHPGVPSTHILKVRDDQKPVCMECAVNVAADHAFYTLTPLPREPTFHEVALQQDQRHANENPHLVDDYSDANPGL